MPLECATIVGIERRESNVRESGPQQRDEIETRPASAVPEDLAHQPLGPVAPYRPADSARRDDSQPTPVQTVRKHEQDEKAALDADTLPLHAEELPAPSDPVLRGESSIHVFTPPRAGSLRRRSPPTMRTPRRRKGASAPSLAADGELPCRFSCSCACGSRASACAAGCLAGTCASCSHHPRGPSPRADPDSKRSW